MAAQANAVNVLYFDAVLCRAAAFEPGEEGGFVATEEPMPVGAEVTVELLAEADASAEPVERLQAKVVGVRENVTGGPAPGMRIRFTGAAAAAAKPKSKPQPPPVPVAAVPADGLEAAAEATEDSFAAPDKTLEISAEIPAAEAAGGTVEAGPAQAELPGTQAPAEDAAPSAEAAPEEAPAPEGGEEAEAAGEGEASAEEGGAPTEAEGDKDGGKKKKRRRKKK